MKKGRIMYVAIILILGMVYLVIDSQLYYYGKSKYNIFNTSLPLEMKPDYWGADVGFPVVGFVVEDRGGIVIIGKGESFMLDGDTIKVNHIIKYGVNQNKLIAVIEDSDSRNYFVECQKNTQPQSKRELEINVLDNNSDIQDDYKWVNLIETEGKIYWLVMIRTYSMLIAIALIIIIPINLFVRKGKK